MLAASRMVPSINKILASIQTFIAGVPAINSISKEINKKSINFKTRKNFFKFKNLKLKMFLLAMTKIILFSKN